MHHDIEVLRRFYYQRSLGRVVQRILRDRLAERWPPESCHGMNVAGYGFAAPMLRPYLATARRVTALAPDRARGLQEAAVPVNTPRGAGRRERRMVRATLLLVTCAAMLGGCAAVRSAAAEAEDPRVQLSEGVAALAEQEYLRARGLLEPLMRERPGDALGQQAWLALIALELDARNPNRRLWAAADLAGRLLSGAPAEPWITPVAESYYLLALELGAAEDRAAQGARTEAPGAALPALPRETVPQRVGRVTSERDQARRQAEQLQQQLATRDRELRETRQELERIRRTIRP